MPFGLCAWPEHKRWLFIGNYYFAVFVEVDFDDAGFFPSRRLVVVAKIRTPPVAVFVFEIISPRAAGNGLVNFRVRSEDILGNAGNAAVTAIERVGGREVILAISLE